MFTRGHLLDKPPSRLHLDTFTLVFIVSYEGFSAQLNSNDDYRISQVYTAIQGIYFVL